MSGPRLEDGLVLFECENVALRASTDRSTGMLRVASGRSGKSIPNGMWSNGPDV